MVIHIVKETLTADNNVLIMASGGSKLMPYDTRKSANMSKTKRRLSTRKAGYRGRFFYADSCQEVESGQLEEGSGRALVASYSSSWTR